MLAPADVRRTKTGVRHEFGFKRDVILFETRILKIERNRVGRDTLETDGPSAERSNAARVEGVRCNCVAHSLGG